MNRSQKSKLYKTRFWKKRRALLKKEQPLCQLCLKKTPKVFKKGVECDHIIPFSNEKEFRSGKIQMLCKPCHTEKTALYDSISAYERKKTKFNFF